MRPQIQRVLFVGRLAAEKNIGQFLALAEHRPDLVYEIVGDGPQRALVQQKADELPNLLFTGWLPRDRVLHHLNDNDLLKLRSSGEAFDRLPLTGYEADLPSRAIFLRCFNQYRRYRAADTGQRLRIGIHPYDLQHRMANDLLQDIHSVARAMNYENYRHAWVERHQ